jgi:hypothetical protein
MKKVFTVLLLVSPFLIIGLLYLVFQFSDPLTAGPGGVLGVFTLIYLGCLSVLFILLRFGLYWVRAMVTMYKKQPQTSRPVVGTKKAYYIASVIAFAPVTLLAMHAYSQLQVADIVLVVVLLTIAIFYIVKRG